MKGQACCHQPPFPAALRGCLWEGRGIYDPRPTFPFLFSVSHTKGGLCPGQNFNLQHFRGPASLACFNFVLPCANS